MALGWGRGRLHLLTKCMIEPGELQIMKETTNNWHIHKYECFSCYADMKNVITAAFAELNSSGGGGGVGWGGDSILNI